MKSQEIICSECDLICKSYKGLSAHLRCYHKMNMKTYYDKYLKEENEGIYKECGKETKYLDPKRGYRNFCSNKCGTKSNLTISKRKQTYFEKTGYNNPSQNPEVKKQKDEKYRNKTDDEKQDIIYKTFKTYFEKTGFTHPTQSLESNIKKEQTCIEKYGVDHPMKCNKVKKKAKQTYFEKTGFDNPNQNPEIKKLKEKTYIKNWGVINPMYVKEILEKQQKSGFKYKDYIMPSGDIRKVQGYEPFALDLLTEQFNESNILTHKGVPTIKYYFQDKERLYYPDIYISSENLIIEVKSTWTYFLEYEKNKVKKEYVLKLNYNFEFWIFDKNGYKVEEELCKKYFLKKD